MFPATLDEPMLAPAVPDARQLQELEALATDLGWPRTRVMERKHLFHAGQPFQALYLVHAGCLKSSICSADGREKITGFHMRGDLLGLDAFGAPAHGCDVVALDFSEVWLVPVAQLDDGAARLPLLRRLLTTALAREIRRDWQWMLTVGTLNAEQRVAAFLLALSERQQGLGYSPRQLTLRMTRADLGNFLALQLETVTRILTRLANLRLIGVAGRQVQLLRPEALRGLVAGETDAPPAPWHAGAPRPLALAGTG